MVDEQKTENDFLLKKKKKSEKGRGSSKNRWWETNSSRFVVPQKLHVKDRPCGLYKYILFENTRGIRLLKRGGV